MCNLINIGMQLAKKNPRDNSTGAAAADGGGCGRACAGNQYSNLVLDLFR